MAAYVFTINGSPVTVQRWLQNGGARQMAPELTEAFVEFLSDRGLI